MRRLLSITSFLLILVAYVESSESIMSEDEMFQCLHKLVCVEDKVEEFYNIGLEAGPKNAQKYKDTIVQVTDVEVPETSLEYIIQFIEIACKWSEERMKKSFNEFCVLIGEYILDVCQQHDSELCIKADIAADQLASVLAKYKAMGVCPKSEVLAKKMPDSVDKMESSPFR